MRQANARFPRVFGPLLAVTGLNNSEWHYQRGQAFLNAKDPSNAEAEFRLAMHGALNVTPVAQGLIKAMSMNGQRSRVIPELLKIAEILPEHDIEKLAFPPYLLNILRRDEGALNGLRNLVAKYPRAREATILLAMTEAVCGNIEESTRLFQNISKHHFGDLHHPDAPPTAPRFLIIGQEKAATTTLFQSLLRHPRMVAPLLKEPNFWSLYYHFGEPWYHSVLPRFSEGSNLFTGESSTTYLIHRDAPERVFQFHPRMKLIVMLRDSVSRVHSHYWMEKTSGAKTDSFENLANEVLQASPFASIDYEPSSKRSLPHNIFYRSISLPCIKRWLQFFPPEQLLILRFQDVRQDLKSVVHRACRFLEVPPFEPEAELHFNVGRYPPMQEELRERLNAWYAPHEEALEAFLATLPPAIP
jgi:hypothetical protein